MNQVGQTIEVQKIDVDKQSEVASLYNIRSVPTVILIKAGIEVNRFSGVQSASTYLNALK
jgi:thioredoxin-like negative regulator of GroEL